MGRPQMEKFKESIKCPFHDPHYSRFLYWRSSLRVIKFIISSKNELRSHLISYSVIPSRKISNSRVMNDWDEIKYGTNPPKSLRSVQDNLFSKK